LNQFDYIAVLVSVIVGLGVVHLLAGTARFLTERGRRKPYWVHLLWTWNVFHYLVFFWWFVWRWSTLAEWSLLLFLFILLYSVCIYLLCVVLYPDPDDPRPAREIYFENRTVFFGLWILLIMVDFADTRLKEHYGLSGFGLGQVLAYLVIVVGSAICARSSDHRVHAAWGILFFAIMSAFEYVNFSVLRAS
jgi:hypothetical protein